MEVQSNNRRYKIINLLVLLVAVILFIRKTFINWKTIYSYINLEKIGYGVLVFFIFFIFNQMLKAVRLYLIILEENIPLSIFIKLFAKTTFINIIYPFKTGEIFRYYSLGKQTNNYKLALMSIIVERYFDTCALIALMIPINIFRNNSISKLTYIFIVIVIFISVIYVIFTSFFNYMNDFFLFKVSNKISLKCLKVLHNINEWYMETKKLIVGRFAFILSISLFAWIIEFIMILILCRIFDFKVTLNSFNEYINAAFGLAYNTLNVFYIIWGTILLGIVVLFVYFVSFKRRRS